MTFLHQFILKFNTNLNLFKLKMKKPNVSWVKWVGHLGLWDSLLFVTLTITSNWNQTYNFQKVLIS